MKQFAISISFVLLALCAKGQTGTFAQNVYPVLEKADCRACHNADGVASATRLHFPPPGAPPESVEAFGRSLVALVDRAHPEESLLFKKPTARMAHAGGQRIKRGTPAETALQGWVKTLAALPEDQVAKALKYNSDDAGSAEARHPVMLRRLTNTQYNNTVRDLLGDVTGPANQFPPEDYVNGFKNQYDAQSLTPMLVEAYSAAAERLARNAFRGGDTHGLIPCKPSVPCRETFVRAFGLKAFRRPLEREEARRYAALFTREADFLTGAKLVVEAMLQSPNFLFRLEDTPKAEWRPYATASRISYAVWDSMPNSALLDSAARGELSTPQGVEKTTRRVLDDPRAHQALDEFFSQWMRLDRILTASKDRRRFPQFTRETAVAMTAETRAFLSDLAWNDRNFMDMFTADYGFMNSDLAAIYGVPAPAKDFERVRFATGSERAGILGQAAFLALTAKPEETSPTARGLFVREQFLCQKVADPPPGVNTNLPPATEAQPQTNRQRLQMHVTDAACSTCHNLIDPIGFGFEKFDAIGGRREKLKLTFASGPRARNAAMKTVELDLDTTGTVAGIPNSAFQSPDRLGAVLAQTPQCQECVVKQYFRYISGRLETPTDRATISGVLSDFRKSQFRFKELIVSLVRAREFPPEGVPSRVATNYQTH